MRYQNYAVRCQPWSINIFLNFLLIFDRYVYFLKKQTGKQGSDVNLRIRTILIYSTIFKPCALGTHITKSWLAFFWLSQSTNFVRLVRYKFHYEASGDMLQLRLISGPKTMVPAPTMPTDSDISFVIL